MDRAMLVPDEVVNDIVRGWLSDSSDSSWILDGYPRTVAQAEVLDNFLKERGSQIDVVVWMDVARELIETRISQRRECSSCGLIVQDANSHVCPECGGEMVARNDDGIESFRRRWKDYEAMTLPVARYYEAKGLVVRIKLDQERPREEVSQELLLKLKAFAE
jgi:adenylate kinase